MWFYYLYIATQYSWWVYKNDVHIINYYFYRDKAQNTKMPPKSGKMSREEELLLEGFSKNDSTKSSALFYGNAFIVSAIPVWLYWRVHSIDITSYAVIFAIGTLVSTWLLAFAYKNTKHLLKHKVAVKRESAVTKEMNKKLADDKKISKKEKDERILWKKNEVCYFQIYGLIIIH